MAETLQKQTVMSLRTKAMKMMILKWWNKPAKQANLFWMMQQLKTSLEQAKKKWQLNSQTKHHEFYFLCHSSFSTLYTGFILALTADNCLWFHTTWLQVPASYIFSGLVHNLWHMIAAKYYEFYFLWFSSFSTLYTGFILVLLAENCFLVACSRLHAIYPAD